MAKKKTEEKEVVPEGVWFKVSEKLPDEFAWVIATDGLRSRQARYCRSKIDGNTLRFRDTVLRHEDITRWQLMPAPVKDEID